MFRNPQGKILRRMFDHAVVHDLAGASSTEKGYIFLLMSAAGNSACPDGSFATNGSMQIQFPDLPAAFNALRSRGYLVDPLPLEELLPTVVVSDLKVLLKSHGLPVSGKRAELVERLLPALTDEDVAHLRETHSFLLPSPLGYEMIYSLYDLWERRQIAVIDALLASTLTGNLDALYTALSHMPHNVGFWDDSVCIRAVSSSQLRTAYQMPSFESAFTLLAGCPLEFNIRSIDEIKYSAPSRPTSSQPAPSRSSSAFKQYAFAPLPDSDPVLPRKRRPIWLILCIVIAIVILWRLCFS